MAGAAGKAGSLVRRPVEGAMQTSDRVMGEPFSGQVGSKSRGPQGEKALEFPRRNKGQTLLPSPFLRVI